MRFFKTDDLELVTLDNVREIYEELKATGDLQDESFDYYLAACQSYNNGSLTEISETDAKRVDVTTVYYSKGNYGDVQHTGKSYSDYIFRLKELIDNGKEIKWEGVNGVIVDEDENKIFQASGYTYDRGLFCDMY